MAIPLRRSEGESQEPKPAHGELYEVALRFLLGLALNFIGKRFKKRKAAKKERQKAAREVAKLAKKGREIPPELKKEATKGLSRRDKKKAAKKAKKKARRRRVCFLLVVIAALVLAYRARKK